MPQALDDAASKPDDDNPEWTEGDFAKARPALEAIAEIFGEQAAQTIRRRAHDAVKDAKV